MQRRRLSFHESCTVKSRGLHSLLVLATLSGALLSCGEQAPGPERRPRAKEVVPDARTAGAESCRTCHPEEYAAWETSPHGRTGIPLATPAGGFDFAIGSSWMQSYLRKGEGRSAPPRSAVLRRRGGPVARGGRCAGRDPGRDHARGGGRAPAAPDGRTQLRARLLRLPRQRDPAAGGRRRGTPRGRLARRVDRLRGVPRSGPGARRGLEGAWRTPSPWRTS